MEELYKDLILSLKRKLVHTPETEIKEISMSPKYQLASPCVGSLTLGDAFFLFSLERFKNTLPFFQSKLIINLKKFRETKTFFSNTP